jgi:glucose/arabinose dehydrogenase
MTNVPMTNSSTHRQLSASRIAIVAVALGCAIAVTFALRMASACGQENRPATEDDYYQIVPLPIPDGVVLEVGGLELLPDGKLAASTRRGEIYLIENPRSDNPDEIKFTRYASGLHEVLGLSWYQGWLYATQRGEVTRIKDDDNDGRADLFETVSDAWEISGDYHEYAFGSKFDREGNLWVVLCLTGSFTSDVKYRGWCLRVSPDGTMTPTCSGLRSPGGIGMNAEGDMFFTDNQGPWNGTCNLKHLVPGSFQGHPIGNRWYEATDALGPRPADPKSGSRIATEAKRIPEYVPPAVLFPYQKMGQSAAGIACDTTGGKFGPFENQLFVGDQTHSTVMRVFLEKVNGRYQGACFPFRQGFSCGGVSLLMTDDGSLFVGGTARGWGSRGGRDFSLDRLAWTGKTPFEVKTMEARPHGFLLTFTEPVDPKTAGDAASYRMPTYTYIFQADYGSPEVDPGESIIQSAEVSDDGLSVRLRVDKLEEGKIHELHMPGVRSREGAPLLHNVAYYTLNAIPN